MVAPGIGEIAILYVMAQQGQAPDYSYLYDPGDNYSVNVSRSPAVAAPVDISASVVHPSVLRVNPTDSGVEVVEVGTLTTYSNPLLTEFPVSICRSLESKSTPVDQLRVLILGTGADWIQTREQAMFANGGQGESLYDVIIGPAPVRFDDDGPFDAMRTLNTPFDFSRSIAQNLDPALAQRQASLIEHALRSELGVPEGRIVLKDLAMHSNGATLGVPLLGQVLAPQNVQALAPALGRNQWTLNGLLRYSEELAQAGGKGKVDVLIGSGDPITAFNLGLLGVIATLAPDWLAFDSTAEYEEMLLALSKSMSTASFNLHVLDSDESKGIVAAHTLDGLLDALKAGRLLTDLGDLGTLFGELESGMAKPLQEEIPFEERESSPLPTLPEEAKHPFAPSLEESDYFTQLQMRATLPSAENLATKRIAYAAKTTRGPIYSKPDSSPSQTLSRMRDQERQMQKYRSLASGSGFAVAGQLRPCPACSHGRSSLSATQNGMLKTVEGLLSSTESQMASTPDFIRDSVTGRILADNRAQKASLGVQIANLRQQLGQLRARGATCTVCNGRGTL